MADSIRPCKITYEFGLSSDTGPEEIAEFSLWSDLGTATLGSTDVDASLTDIASKSYAAWVAHMPVAAWRAGVVLNNVKAAQLDLSLHTQHEQVHVETVPWKGTAAAPSLPWQCSFCVGLYSYTPGTFIPDAKSRRGRIYMPPFSSSMLDHVNSGTLADASVDTFLGSVKDWLVAVASMEPAAFTGSTILGLGVLSRVTGKARRAVPQLYSLTDVAADGVIDTQRRRTHQEARSRRTLGLGSI